MRLDNYYSNIEGTIQFSRWQASNFAKQIADDFNPLHDTDAKLFCVPGDLLFSMVLAKYGLSQRMRFVFTGMVNDKISLKFQDSDTERVAVTDETGKEYLTVEREGATSTDPDLIQSLTCRYVEFSGDTFPHILVPLMAEHRVMINPARPLVIYESMEINLERLDIVDPVLELSSSRLEINGKKGDVQIAFCLKAGGEVVGQGAKYMALRGLRAFEQNTIDRIVSDYNLRKQTYSC